MQQEEFGFFKSLFDFNLKHFITLKVIRLLYGISVVVIVLLGVLLVTVSFAGGGTAGSYKFLVLILTPVGVLFYIIMARLWVEFLANFYRIGDNVQKLADNLPTE